MQAGNLRHRAALDRRQDVQNAYGEVVPGYIEFARVWCGIRPLSGREYFAAQQVQAEAMYEITMRYRPGLNETNRVRVLVTAAKLGEEVYDVVDVAEDAHSGRQWLTLRCSRRRAEGWRTENADRLA